MTIIFLGGFISVRSIRYRRTAPEVTAASATAFRHMLGDSRLQSAWNNVLRAKLIRRH